MSEFSTVWLPHQIEHLKRRRAEGVSGARIAEELCTTKGAVAGKAHRLKLPRPGVIILTAKREGVKRSSKPKPRLPRPEPRKRPAPKPLSAAPAQPPPPAELLPPLNVPLMQLRFHHCRNVEGRGADGLAVYCGHPRVWNRSFCAGHCKIFYVPIGERRR